MDYYAASKKNVLNHSQAIKGEKQSVEQHAQNGPICVNKKEYIC